MRAETARPSKRKERIRESLRGFADGLLEDRARDLLEELDYSSSRHIEIGPEPRDFIDEFETPEGRPIAKRQRELILETWKRVAMVFQYTDEELGEQGSFFDGQEWDDSRPKSFLFLAVDLRDKDYSRSDLAAMTRAVNRPFAMPVIVFFRYRRSDDATAVTLAVIHRRAHKRDANRDVLERATLIKDMRVGQPHRAHIDILSELAIRSLALERRTFDVLLAAWERVLDTRELNRRFYRELFAWFRRAVAEARFPADATAEEQVIRLITRILFIWFAKEKRLVSEDWFDERQMRALLRDFGAADYYRAVLQNLFFATLNTPMDQRGFSTRRHTTHRVFSRYRYRSLIRDTDRFTSLMAATPFINGGLFDCLDDELSRSAGGRRIDMFSDPDPQDGPMAAKARRAAWRSLNVPDSLFFGEGGLFTLLRHYKFTVEENTPVEVEVALDPELLGRVFENLLAAHNPETRDAVRGDRKRTGSFYTPRQIVDYLVDQALILALGATARPADGDADFWRERLRYLLDYEDAGELFEEADTRAIIRAISKLTVLDPAVGSGAFAMAAIQKLTLALRRLDPDNRTWQQVQKERAVERAESAFDEGEQATRDAELLEISEAFSRYSGDFGRKLYLIQNSIYGVDIQPIACQIARLRFFISLAIEQEPDPSADNLGITPLPNLDTRIVAASTLLSLTEEIQRVLPGRRIQDIEERLAANRERHFHARTRPEKLECIRADRLLRGELATALREAGFPDDIARKIADWDPYDQNASADWFDPEYMFNVRDGFDIVIGNPPYVRADFPDARHRELRKRLLASEHYDTLWEKWDLFVPFIERGFRLLKPGGAIAYIVSDAYCHAKYAEKSRDWFLRNARIVRLDFLSKLRIFDAAVRNVIFVYRKADGSMNAPERRVHEGRFGKVSHLATDRQDRLTTREVFFPEDGASPEAEYRNRTIPLNRICYISVGLVAHADEKRAPGAFRLADLVAEERDELHPKRFAEGKHLARWLPATHRWLEWGTPRAPALFRRPTFPEMYEVEEKLIAQRSPGPDPVTCLDAKRLRFPESCVGFVLWNHLSGVRNRSIKLKTRYADETPKRPDLPPREDLEETSRRFTVKFLLGVMNSSMARDFLLANRRSNIHLYPDDWAKLPIPDCAAEKQAAVVAVVEAILEARARDPAVDVEGFEAELDRLVAGLYGVEAPAKRPDRTVRGRRVPAPHDSPSDR